MLDAGVIGYFKSKAGKKGYQPLINESLKRIIAENQTDQPGLENILRKVIREELGKTSA